MKCKKILLINNNPKEIEEFQTALKQIDCIHTLHVASTGNEALSILMGSSSAYNSSYSKTKMQPDMVFMNDTLSDMSASDFLSIMRRYYSLKNIKVYVTTSSSDTFDKITTSRYGISGLLEKPFDLKNNNTPAFVELRSNLVSSDKQSAFLTLLPVFDFNNNITSGIVNFIKAKSAVISQALNLKMATCAVSLVVAGSVATYTGNTPDKNVKEKERISENQKLQAETNQPNVTTLNVSVENLTPEIVEEPVLVMHENQPKKKAVKKHTVKQVSPQVASVEPKKTWNPSIRVERDTTVAQ